jgi:HNH endonuclease
MISRERLMDVLSYDPDTGIFTWKIQSGRMKPGQVAGTKHSQGYVVISIDRKFYFAHRLAWIYVYGDLPEADMDHKNRVRNDNRISNLRKSDRTHNNANKPSCRDGLKGCHFVESVNKWRSTIKKDGIKIHIGYFNTELEANEAYFRIACILFGEFARAK